MALRTKVKYGLSAAMLALIAASASAPQLLDQFLQEREGNTLVAVRDNGGVWSVCRGVTRTVTAKCWRPHQSRSKMS
ncbi:Phage endolysin R [Salmonella enterica]|nr:Phage endolysin R [Salmonella enterica]